MEAGLVPGGAALYAALAAAGLGCRARILTSHGDDFVGLPLLAAAGVTVEGGGGPRTTTFRNAYTGGAREEQVLAIAEPLGQPAAADVVLCAPVIGEVAPAAIAGPFVGAGLQGWLRRLDERGFVRRRRLGDASFLAPCRAVFLSQEDIAADDEALVTALRAIVPIVVVTRGAAGADVHGGGSVAHVPACPAREVDPTGAGDVFAAAFLIALARGEDPVGAGRFAAAAASIAVEDVGPAALARLSETEERLRWYTS